MKITEGSANMASSVQSAFTTATLKDAVEQDEESVDRLLEGMDDVSQQIETEQQAEPHKGQNLNLWA